MPILLQLDAPFCILMSLAESKPSSISIYFGGSTINFISFLALVEVRHDCFVRSTSRLSEIYRPTYSF